MDSKKLQITERSSSELSALVAWAQAMPRSTLSIPKTDDDVEQPKIVVAEFNALKEQVAQLNAQVKELTDVVDGLQDSVEHLEWDYQRHSPNGGKKRRASTEDNQLSPESSQLPAYINALKSLQYLSGHELQQVLKNYNLEWSGLGSDEMRREIMRQTGFGHFLVDRKTRDNE